MPASVNDPTVFFEVAALINPADGQKPFAVVEADTKVHQDGGVPATVISLHWTREEADLAADRLAGRKIN